jgi:hypothetical protein
MKSPARKGATITSPSVRKSTLVRTEGNRMTEGTRKVNLLQLVRAKQVGEGNLIPPDVSNVAKQDIEFLNAMQKILNASGVVSQGTLRLNARVPM